MVCQLYIRVCVSIVYTLAFLSIVLYKPLLDLCIVT